MGSDKSYNIIKFGLAFTVMLLLLTNLDAGVLKTSDGVYEPTTGYIGLMLFEDYLLPFEALSLLLTAVMVGSIVIAKKDDNLGGERT